MGANPDALTHSGPSLPGRTLVGRVGERALLAESLRAALDGRRQVVLVAGEPGVGKTRLAEEAQVQARALGMADAVGRASEDEGTPPYWPFRQVLQSLGLAPTELDSAATAGERFRLFEAVSDHLVDAAQPGGLLVVLDDLQWADGATLRLLVHLAGAVTPARLMVVATYRDTETAGREPLRAALGAMAREGCVARVRLGGLSETEVAARLAEVTGWAVPDSVAAAICRRTAGNPFFVGELGRVLATSPDGRLPDGVRDAVRDRLHRLSARTREHICAAAVLGSDVDAGALAYAMAADVTDVLVALDEATAAGILGADGRFAHDLIREAARLEVPTAQRLTLHRRMAEHLGVRGDSGSRVAEIAFHRLESLPAGDPALAVSWARRAAERAMAELAWEDAASWYRRALDAGDVHAILTSADRFDMMLGVADARVRTFELEEARQSLLAAAEIARTVTNAEWLARAALTMEGVNYGDWDVAGRALCEEALAALPPVDSALRVRLLARVITLSEWHVPTDGGQRSAEALAMAERVGDRRALREALRARQMALSGPEGAADRLALGDRMVALGADGDDDAVLWGRLWRFDALAQLADLDGAEAELDPISAVAQRLRSPLAAWHLARCRAAVAAARGRFEQALAFGREAQAAAIHADRDGAHLPSQGLMGMLHNQMGDLDAFDFDPARMHLGVPGGGFQQAIYVGWLLTQGRREEALPIYRTLTRIEHFAPFVYLSAYANLAEMAWEFDDAETATKAYRALLPYADLSVCGGAGVVMILGSVRYPLGLAAATMGRLDDAVRHLRAAIDSGERSGSPPLVAQARARLAGVLARRRRPGDRDEAAALATAAAELAGRLGMVPARRWARDLLDSLAGGGAAPLTRREREIAGLVAQGLSNRQIAATTHISERTVESHVQHILDKLGFTNRTQVATWVRGEQGNLRTGPA